MCKSARARLCRAALEPMMSSATDTSMISGCSPTAVLVSRTMHNSADLHSSAGMRMDKALPVPHGLGANDVFCHRHLDDLWMQPHGLEEAVWRQRGRMLRLQDEGVHLRT